MLDERRAIPAPTPHLRTRPVTVLTALGLCLIIMLIQFTPGMEDRISRQSPSPMAASQQR